MASEITPRSAAAADPMSDAYWLAHSDGLLEEARQIIRGVLANEPGAIDRARRFEESFDD